MNLSDLVHRSTNGHHDHPVDSFFVPSTMHQQKSHAPSSSSSSTSSSSSSSSTTVAEAATTVSTTTTTTTTASHPLLYDTTIYPSSHNVDGLPDSATTQPSQLQHRHYFDHSHSMATTPPPTTNPSQPKHGSSSPLNQFCPSQTFFQPKSPAPPPSSSTGTAAATLSHLNHQQQEEHLINKKATTTPLSSSPSSPSSSTFSSFIIDSHEMASSQRSSSLLKQQQQYLSKTKHILSPKHQQPQQQESDSSEGKIAVQTVLPLDDEELLRRKRHARLQPLTINGENVCADNIEDGYIQFILHHDPDSIGDGIDSLMYVRRKFSSVPRTGDLSYTTWDVYVLVNKLYNREIKNWSQLVGQLGLSDMLGRPQFAQRVKRWMHKYKIDYYFDYLMGTPFDFFSEDEKYSGCLLMGNYQKRKELGDWSVGSGDDLQQQQLPSSSSATTTTTSTTSAAAAVAVSAMKKRRRKIMAPSSSFTDPGDGDGSSTNGSGGGGDAFQRPILMAGSRKRMRGDTQQSSLLLVDKQRTDDTDDDEDDIDDDDDDDNDDDDMHGNRHHMDRGSDDDMDVEDQGSGTENDDHRGILQQPTARKRSLEKEKEIDEDEEDELASTSSTSGSPIQSPALPSLPSPHPLPPSYNHDISNQITKSTISPSATTYSPSNDKKWVGETSHSDSSPSTISFNFFDPLPANTVANTITTTNCLGSPSSSSSPSSPPIPAASVIPHLHPSISDNPCSSCVSLVSTVAELQTKVSMLTQHMDTFVSKWKPMMESRSKSLQQQVDALTDENQKMHTQWTLWRKNLVNGLLEDPFQ